MRASHLLPVLAAFLATGCLNAGPKPAAAAPATTSASKENAMNLTGTSWKVVSYHDGQKGLVPVIEGTGVSLAFAEGSVSGSTGCNRFHATAKVDGNRLTCGPAAATRMACAGVAGVMEQEAAFLSVFGTVTGFRLSGDRLELTRQDGSVGLTARRE